MNHFGLMWQRVWKHKGQQARNTHLNALIRDNYKTGTGLSQDVSNLDAAETLIFAPV
jgi:hypothetical protein